MIQKLGSLYFAIALIILTLLFVIAGTFLESLSESHLFAATFTYQNPIFQGLLWLYFVNILCAALKKYPFRKKHLPFLLTHLGLLLLLLGVFVKNHFGLQGVCALSEGSGTSQLFLPNTYALHIENLDSSRQIKLKKERTGRLAIDGDVELNLIEWTPHVREKLEGFIKGNWGHICGLPPFEIKEGSPSLALKGYQIYAFSSDPNLPFPKEAALIFFRDAQERERLIAFNAQGEKFETSLSDHYYVYNKGYGGYALSAELPPSFPPLELLAPLTRSWKVEPLPIKREEATPLICLIAQSAGRTEKVHLTFDKYGQGLKWPILGGKYLVRFQSLNRAIPIHLRLRSATQVNYPGSTQPYSYEAKIWADQEEAALSMNKVYEKKGYRFYLANLITNPAGANKAQIVINHDPAKYWLTYPGGIILALGIALLYIQRRYV